MERVNVVTDPVCLMVFEEGKARATSVHNGEMYYFCSLMCKDRFDREYDKTRFISRLEGDSADLAR